MVVIALLIVLEITLLIVIVMVMALLIVIMKATDNLKSPHLGLKDQLIQGRRNGLVSSRTQGKCKDTRR